MSSFFDLMGDDGHVHFEKCGDVVVSPKDNMVAMFCHFCKDIFTHLPVFMRHLHYHHGDVLQFTKEQNVYRVEELLSLESSEEDVQSQANSCSSGDSGLAGEMEDADKTMDMEIMNALAAFDVDIDGLNASYEQSPDADCQTEDADRTMDMEIMKALAAFDVDVDGLNASYEQSPPADCQTDAIEKKGVARNILSEVEAMLLEDEDEAVDHRAEEKISAELIITETSIKKTYCKVNYTEKEIEAHNPKGFRRARKPGSVEKPSTCDLKSYNITRHSRKKEAMKQRLSSVKKRIMRSIENDVTQPVLLNLAARPRPIKGNGVKQELTSVNVDRPRINKPRSRDNERSSNSLSSVISGPAKQSKLSALLESSFVNELPTVLESSKADNFGSEQPFVVSAKIKPFIRACPSRAEAKTNPKISHQPVAKKTPVKIERVDVLPPINIKQNMDMSTKENPFGENINWSSVASQQPSKLNATNKNAVDQESKRPGRRSSPTVVSSSPIQAEKPKPMTTADTPQNSRILPSETVESLAKTKKRTKDTFEETEKGEAKRSKLEENICFMNSKIDADNLLQLAELLESNAFENTLVEDQVKKETKLGSPQKQELPTAEIGYKSGLEAVREDLRLLNTIGLPIIKDSCFEDKLPLEQSESFRKTAAIFSKVYHTYDTIWNYRKTKTVGFGSPLVRLTEHLNSFCEKVNKEIGCHLTTNEMKRILNLINFWYAYQVDQRFFKKASPSYSVEHYMSLFNFLPKIHPVYFCEFCEETFPNESRQTKHYQSIHGVHAFTCSECGKSFKRLCIYEKHFNTVHLKPKNAKT